MDSTVGARVARCFDHRSPASKSGSPFSRGMVHRRGNLPSHCRFHCRFLHDAASLIGMRQHASDQCQPIQQLRMQCVVPASTPSAARPWVAERDNARPEASRRVATSAGKVAGMSLVERHQQTAPRKPPFQGDHHRGRIVSHSSSSSCSFAVTSNRANSRRLSAAAA